MLKRELYLKQLKPFIDKPLIKVIAGIRRSGKSVILKLLKNELVEREIDENQIIYLNFESLELSDISNAEKLYSYIKKRTTKNKRSYLLLDEIQEVKSWERAVNSFLADFDVDIYITGSNSRLLSSELATYLTGRYVEIHLFTLSFSEHLRFKSARTGITELNIKTEFENFLRIGGFPVLHIAEYPIESAYRIVFDIYSSAILRDTIQRHKIRDVELLERVVKFVFDNVGNKFSAKNVADYFKSQQRKIDLNTVYNYLNALESAFIIDRIPRYDLVGKEILKTFEKYFVGDQAIIYSVMGYKDRMISGVLENIVMLELKRRGFKVFTGKWGEREVDFVAEKNENKIYVQVAYKLTEQSTIDREFNTLLEIKDNHPKYVVTMDEFWKDNIEGVKHVYIADFLLMENWV
ncbi:MAG: ATP-binding protein [Bacteroidales bacterium]